MAGAIFAAWTTLSPLPIAYFQGAAARALRKAARGIALLRLVELVARQQFFHRAELRRRHTTRANDETSN